MSVGHKLLDFLKITDKVDTKRRASQKLPQGVTQITDIKYINDDNPMHTLDVYYPKTPPQIARILTYTAAAGFMETRN